jgi:hypothetical protein
VAAAVPFFAAQIIIFQPLPLKQLLDENGWVPLPLPDKRMAPGSVIKVTKKDGAVTTQWLGDLRRCGITDRKFRYMRGKYPAIGIGDSFGIKASIAAGYIAKLEGTADFEKAGGAIMQIEASGGDAVDFDALTSWMARSAAGQRMPQVCSNFLAQRIFISSARLFESAKPVTASLIKTGEAHGYRRCIWASGGAIFGHGECHRRLVFWRASRETTCARSF